MKAKITLRFILTALMFAYIQLSCAQTFQRDTVLFQNCVDSSATIGILPVQGTGPRDNTLMFSGPVLPGSLTYCTYLDHQYNKLYVAGEQLQIIDYNNLTGGLPTSTIRSEMVWGRIQDVEEAISTLTNKIYFASFYGGLIVTDRQTGNVDVVRDPYGFNELDFVDIMVHDAQVHDQSNMLYTSTLWRFKGEQGMNFEGLQEWNLSDGSKRWIVQGGSALEDSLYFPPLSAMSASTLSSTTEPPDWVLHRIFIDDVENVLYFSTRYGLWWWDRINNSTGFLNKREGFSLAPSNPAIPSDTVTHLFIDHPNNTFYIGTDKGLFVWNRTNSSSRIYNTFNSPVADNRVNYIDKSEQNDLIYVAFKSAGLLEINASTGDINHYYTDTFGHDTGPQIIDTETSAAYFDETDQKLYVSASGDEGGVWINNYGSLIAFNPYVTLEYAPEACRGTSVSLEIESQDSLSITWGDNLGSQNSVVVNPDSTTTYTFTIGNELGCTVSDSVTVTVIEPVTANILPTVPVCPGDSAALEAAAVAGATYTWKPGSLTGQTVNVLVNELQQYTLTVTGSNGCTAEATAIPEIRTIAVAGEDREICVADSVTLVAEGGDTYLWSTGETTPEITFNPTSPGVYDLSFTATRDGCSASDTVTVTVQEFCPGTPTGFLARAISTTEIELNWQESPGNHTQYVIQRLDSVSAAYQTVATVPTGTTFWGDAELLAGTIYYYRIYSEAGTQQSEKKYARARTFTPNENYVMETEVLTGEIVDVAFVPNLNYDQRNSTWNYLNGLGGDMQTVVEGASPSQKDVVHPIIHDEFGLQSRQYLSYTIDQPTKPGNYREEARQETLDFYVSPPEGVAGTTYPWAETVFDSSPQNRVLEQASPGEDWEVSTGRTVKIDRTTNGGDEVLLWQLSGSSVVAKTNYPARQLRKTVTVNEDDETVIVYEDMLGRELMRTVQLATGAITSYFVYNNRGSLLYRITPKVAETLSGPLPYTLDQNTLAQECYSYRYDDQERLIEEKWPDQEAIFYAYDEWDRLVLSQSGNQRLTHQWTFTKYDRFNRPILTGLMDTTVALTPAEMNAVIDAHYAKPSSSRFETYGSNVHGYTNQSYPIRSDEQVYLSVTYYDDYDFINNDPTFGAAYSYDATVLGCEPSPQGNYCFPSTPLKVLRGKVTGSRTRVLGRSQWLNGVVYYDEKGRTIQAVAQGHTGGIDRASTLHNFAGWPLATFSTMAAPNGDTYGIRRRFVYDHSGRLREGYHQLFKNGVGNGEKFLAENIYNELGQLMEKNLHIDQHLPLQSVDYRYNIRGWLESINNVRFSVDSRNNDINDLFGMELIYQNMLNGVLSTTN